MTKRTSIHGLCAWALVTAVVLVLPGSGFSERAKGEAKKGVAEVFVDRGETYVRAGSKQGLKVGSTVQIVGPTIGDTEERRNVGTATVLEVWESLARAGEKYARVDGTGGAKPSGTKAAATAVAPVAEKEPPPAPSAPPPPPKQEGLEGRAELNKGRVVLYNMTSFTWTNCDVRLPSNRHYIVKSLRPGDQEGIMLFRFTQDGIPYDRPNDSVLVKCTEGEKRFSLTGG